MSVTRLFRSSRRAILRLGWVGVWFITSVFARPQSVPPAVSSQANIDASAQRRLQENAREAQRRRRIEEQIRNLAPALFPDKLAGSDGPVLTRRALAALVRLREDGVSLDEAIPRATRSCGIDSAEATKPAAYLRNLFIQNSGRITPAILAKLETGEDPGPDLVLSPFVP